MHILWVDDEPWYLVPFQDWMEANGIICEFEADPEKALKIFSRYDLVITDFHMGLLTGDNVLEGIRQTNTTIPVLLFSGTPEKSKMLKSYTGVFEKGDPEPLLRCVKKKREEFL